MSSDDHKKVVGAFRVELNNTALSEQRRTDCLDAYG